jgi:hypothetical protein
MSAKQYLQNNMHLTVSHFLLILFLNCLIDSFDPPPRLQLAMVPFLIYYCVQHSFLSFFDVCSIIFSRQTVCQSTYAEMR